MKTATKKCFICGETIIESSLPICETCRQKDLDVLLKAQDFHRKNPGARLIEIAEMTGIPYRMIIWYYNNGKLGYNQNFNHNRFEKNNGILITDTIYGDYIWVEVSGKIDSANSSTLQQYIDALIEDGWTQLILDMSAVSFFSSTGIRVVMTVYKKVRELDGIFRITNPSNNVKNVLGMVALDTLLL